MRRTCLSSFMLMMLLITACGSVGVAPPTEALPSPAATQPPSLEPSASPTPMPSLTSTPNTEAPPDLPDYAPRGSDKNLTRGEAFVEESGVLTLESFPPQFRLSLIGTLPTPCHQLRVALAPPDAQDQIVVEVYTVVDPDLMCMQVLAPFSATVPLEGYAVGPTYQVLVNGAPVGEFTPQAP